MVPLACAVLVTRNVLNLWHVYAKGNPQTETPLTDFQDITRSWSGVGKVSKILTPFYETERGSACVRRRWNDFCVSVGDGSVSR